jgi:hypothetical protein
LCCAAGGRRNKRAQALAVDATRSWRHGSAGRSTTQHRKSVGSAGCPVLSCVALAVRPTTITRPERGLATHRPDSALPTRGRGLRHAPSPPTHTASAGLLQHLLLLREQVLDLPCRAGRHVAGSAGQACDARPHEPLGCAGIKSSHQVNTRMPRPERVWPAKPRPLPRQAPHPAHLA